ncbi:MAG: S8 family serine peptidase [Clostridia bacterium]|nr:S8 family serine peptidase [Clostridia bacterium]
MSLKKSVAIVFSAILLTFASTVASAQEYLFKLRKDTVALFSENTPEFMSEECFSDNSALATVGKVYTTDDLSVIQKYKEMGLLDYYEENAPAYLLDMPNTNEFMSSLMSGYVPLGESFAQLNVNELWKLGLNGKGITVGVVDSGANAHTELADNLLSGYNTYDSNYITADGVYHGTMVSGLIAANGTSYRGVAYNSKIVPLKAFNDSGAGNTSTMANGIYKAVDEYNCDIINMSCGSLTNSLTLKDAVKYAINKGVIIIAASGNVSGSKYGTATVGTKDNLMYPACYDGVISVGNIDRYGNLSNTSMENDYVDVVANGKYITGLSNTNLSGYTGNSGTSFSCPIVTGVVACMLQVDPTLTPKNVEKILQETATDLGTVGRDISYGYGKVNCEAIVRELLEGKLYKSDIVEYKGTYNIAIRNGLDSVYNRFLAFANYSGNKMVGISTKSISLVKGESRVLTLEKKGSLARLFDFSSLNFAP